MNANRELVTQVVLNRPGLVALLAPHAGAETMLLCAALLARRGRLQVFDGGNRFNVYPVARLLSRMDRAGMMAALGRIRVARAFTCYQMAALLAGSRAGAVAGNGPLLVLDLLDTFYDDSVDIAERRRLLDASLEDLRRLAVQAQVLVSVRPPPPPRQDPLGLVQKVEQAADRVIFPAGPEPILPPPRLF